jgi:hypothetical protein
MGGVVGVGRSVGGELVSAVRRRTGSLTGSGGAQRCCHSFAVVPLACCCCCEATSLWIPGAAFCVRNVAIVVESVLAACCLLSHDV